MPEKPTNEFWMDLKPIENALKPDAQPEVFHQFAPIDDERYYVPLSETAFSRPLWISPSTNRWADILWSKGPGLVNRHYHPHEVFAYTISGKWGYLEQPWTATAGSFVYETPGEGHTLVAYDHEDDMRANFVVTGPLIWLDENGESTGMFDVHDYIALCREYYEKSGIGADYVDTLIR
jgi:2,4'-dihydroxyacetophenone dioxygenase